MTVDRSAAQAAVEWQVRSAVLYCRRLTRWQLSKVAESGLLLHFRSESACGIHCPNRILANFECCVRIHVYRLSALGKCDDFFQGLHVSQIIVKFLFRFGHVRWVKFVLRKKNWTTTGTMGAFIFLKFTWIFICLITRLQKCLQWCSIYFLCVARPTHCAM